MKKTNLMFLVALYFTGGNIVAMDMPSKPKFDGAVFKKNVENAHSLGDIKKLMNGSLDKGGFLEFNFKKGFYKKNGDENEITKKRLEVLNRCFACELNAALKSPECDALLKDIKAKYPIKDSVFHDINYVVNRFYDPAYLPLTYDQDKFEQLVTEFKDFVGIVPVGAVPPKVIVPDKLAHQSNSKNVLAIGCVSACIVAALYGMYKLYVSKASNQDLDEQDVHQNTDEIPETI